MNNKVDVLFVVDNSGSMLTKQQKLASGFASFASVFVTEGFDFHVAVISTDIPNDAGVFKAYSSGGTTNPYVITSLMANFNTLFEQNVALGTNGDTNNAGMEAVELAMSPATLASTNANFLRSDAHLAVISMSDADDDDIDLYPGVTPTSFVNFLTALKPDVYDEVSGAYKHNFTVSAVVAESLSDPDCAMPFEVGSKFISVANATGGSVASICTADFSAGLTQISQTIVEAITQIPLSSVPDVSTLSVLFNGVAVPNDATNGWTYVSSGNKIVFHGTAIPTPNTSISVDFTPNDITR